MKEAATHHERVTARSMALSGLASWRDLGSFWLAPLVWAFLCSPALIAAAPELHDVAPAGAQRGTTVQITLTGARLENPQAVLFYDPGITVAGITAVDPKSIKVDCVIAVDCPLGEHRLRLRTAAGITELRTIWVGALPVVAEVEPNSEFEKPQTVPLNCTVAGVIKNEDVDYFVVEAKAGQRITAEIEAMRLGRAMFDPYVAILDARRFELATCDDSALLLQDSIASIIAPTDGKYTILVRETSYGGGDDFHYRLHVGTFPQPLVAFPSAVNVGRPVGLELLGDVRGTLPLMVAAPTACARLPLVVLDGDGVAVSPNWVRVTQLPCVVKSEVPATAPVGSQPASAPSAPSAPVAFDGQLVKSGQSDAWRFAARKDQTLDINVFARRLRSPLDSVLEICDAAGKSLATNDDAVGPDSYLRFAPPADGEFEVRVRDQRGRGSPLFVYHVEIEPPRPELSLSLERVDSKRPQFLQALAVPRGNRMAALVRVDRKDVNGAVQISVADLPKGVTLDAATIPAEGPLAPIVLEAAADAPLDGGLFPVRGKLAREGGELVGDLRQATPLVLGAPNDTVYYQTETDRLALAVTEPAPFRVQLIAPPTPLLRNGSLQLKVLVDRVADFKGEVVVQMLWNPPGISSASNITIAADQSEGLYPLNAAGDAAPRTNKIAVLAKATVGGGEQWLSSQLEDITVAEQFFNGSLQLAATEQGKPAAMLCKLEVVRACEGTAQVRLYGLPPKTACAMREIKPDEKEIVFNVTTEPDAPLGEHGGLFCELTAQIGGQPVVQRLAFNGKLRIDKPKPADVAAVPPPPAGTPAPAPAKPLSRREPLRQSAGAKPAPPTGEKSQGA